MMCNKKSRTDKLSSTVLSWRTQSLQCFLLCHSQHVPLSLVPFMVTRRLLPFQASYLEMTVTSRKGPLSLVQFLFVCLFSKSKESYPRNPSADFSGLSGQNWIGDLFLSQSLAKEMGSRKHLKENYGCYQRRK